MFNFRDKISLRFTGKYCFPFKHLKSHSADRIWAYGPTVQGTEEEKKSDLHLLPGLLKARASDASIHTYSLRMKTPTKNNNKRCCSMD